MAHEFVAEAVEVAYNAAAEKEEVVSSLIVQPEVLLVLVFVLVASTAWLVWEISLSLATADRDATNNDWWEALKHCQHHRLIIPVS